MTETCVHQTCAQKIRALEVGPIQEHPAEVDVGPLTTAQILIRKITDAFDAIDLFAENIAYDHARRWV